MDQRELRDAFGDCLAYYGSISTLTVLPQGPQEVKRAVDNRVAALAPDGTGLMLTPMHRLKSDVPVGNVDALLQQLAGPEGCAADSCEETKVWTNSRSGTPLARGPTQGIQTGGS